MSNTAATAKQIAYIIKMIGWVLADTFIAEDIEMGLFKSHSDLLGFDINIDLDSIDKDTASKMIGSLKTVARKPVADPHAAADKLRAM